MIVNVNSGRLQLTAGYISGYRHSPSTKSLLELYIVPSSTWFFSEIYG